MGLVAAPQGVDHGDRASAHGRDVADIDHHPAEAGEIRIGGHEPVHEPFDGEEEVAVAIGNRGAIVAQGHGERTVAQAEPPDHRVDVAFMGEAAPVSEMSRDLGEGLYLAHAHAACFRRVTRPCSGSAMAG